MFYDPQMEYKKQLNNKVKEYDRKLYAKKKKSFSSKNIMTSACTQCKRGMKKSLADKQIENKKTNAPICIPCILGTPRKAIELNRYTKDVEKKFIEYKNKYNQTEKP